MNGLVGALARMRRVMGSVLSSGGANTVEVVIHTRTLTGLETYDPYLLDGADDVEEEAEKRTTRALCHRVTQEEVVRRGYANVLAGNLILDFRYDEDLTGGSLLFEVEGLLYARKDSGEDLRGNFEDTPVERSLPFQTVVVAPVAQG